MCGALPAEIGEQMSKNLPKLFEKDLYRSVLYVGANKRRQHFLEWFENAGYSTIVVLEAFEENYNFLKFGGMSPPCQMVHGDVRNVDGIFAAGTFDIAFFWHGIEHLQEEEIAPVLAKLEAVSRIVVLGCPHGKYKQGPEYGNPFEEHLSAVYPRFLEELGYSTDVMGKADERDSNVLAWKFSRRNGAGGGMS